MKTLPLVVSSALGSLLTAAVAPFVVARADDLESTLGEPLTESAHVVEARFVDGRVEARVERRFLNSGGIADEAVLGIVVPNGAAARGLRIRSGERWYEGRLFDRDEAADTYETLTGLGARAPRDPALLQWNGTDSLQLQVFPVLPGVEAVVAYDLVVPAVWDRGAHRVVWPVPPEVPDPALAPLDLRVTADEGERVEVDRATGEIAIRPAAPPEGPGAARIAAGGLPPSGFERIGGRLGIAQAAPGKGFFRLDVEAPPALSAPPSEASVVFVVDGSISTGADGVRAQLRVAKEYLAHVPDARFEVVVFRRRAERLEHRFVPARDAGELLDPARIPLGNGSDAAAGLRLALAAVATAPAPRRIVLLTDGLLASRGGIDEAVSAIGAGVPDLVLHVAVTGARAGAVYAWRDDEHLLAPIAAAGGGILQRLDLSPDEDDPTLPAAVLSLVRPIRLDDVRVVGLPKDTVWPVPDALDEGTGFVLFDAAPNVPSRVVVEGKLWARPVRRVFEADPALESLTAAWVFPAGLAWGLEEPAQKRLAHLGRAASPVTSWLAIEPGAAPSTAGIERGFGRGGGSFGVGLVGYGVGYASSGTGRTWIRSSLYDLAIDRASSCFREGRLSEERPVVLSVETTKGEIADVAVTEGEGLDAAPCFVEALWETRLDPTWDQVRESAELRFTGTL